MTKTRLLLVEDELLIRMFLAEALDEAGYQVVEAATGDEAAAELAGPDGFHLILTDMQIPGGLDGVAVGQTARARHPTIPIIYMTGRPDALQRVGALTEREAILLKPYGPSQVLALVERLLKDDPATSSP